jgi:hypothetical protein
MATSGNKPTTPDQRVRDLRREFRAFEQETPGPDRAARLAGFVRAANAERQLNMAMHAATLCLEEDPEPPSLLLAAYDDPSAPLEEQLHTWGDLRDLGRYLDRPDVVASVEERQRTVARAWVAEAAEGERRYRLRTVQSATSRELADDLRDELHAGN